MQTKPDINEIVAAISRDVSEWRFNVIKSHVNSHLTSCLHSLLWYVTRVALEITVVHCRGSSTSFRQSLYASGWHYLRTSEKLWAGVMQPYKLRQCTSRDTVYLLCVHTHTEKKRTTRGELKLVFPAKMDRKLQNTEKQKEKRDGLCVVETRFKKPGKTYSERWHTSIKCRMQEV